MFIEYILFFSFFQYGAKIAYMNKKQPLSYIEISKGNLINNMKEFKSFVSKNTKVAAVIKSNAYGHGDVECVKILNPYVDYFQIDSIEELRRIRPFAKKDILVFGYIGMNDIDEAIKLGCILSAFDFEHLLKINNTAKKLGVKQKVHIAIDSCLGREGIMPNQVENYIKEIKNLKNVVIDGVYSHFANIEDTMNFSHAEKQISTYHKAVEIFKNNGFENIHTHISATSGAMIYEKNNNLHSIVRIGIGLYGLWPSDHLEFLLKKKINLLPVLKWVTHIAQIKTLPANHSIGYGLSFITKKNTKIAVIPQGYADGLNRALSNNGEVLIKGKKAKILGRIAMNMFVVDVSGIKDVNTEDEVVIIGSMDKNTIKAEAIALKMNSINYEVVTKISPFLPRIVI